VVLSGKCDDVGLAGKAISTVSQAMYDETYTDIDELEYQDAMRAMRMTAMVLVMNAIVVLSGVAWFIFRTLR
jgi:hypothetical protein